MATTMELTVHPVYLFLTIGCGSKTTAVDERQRLLGDCRVERYDALRRSEKFLRVADRDGLGRLTHDTRRRNVLAVDAITASKNPATQRGRYALASTVQQPDSLRPADATKPATSGRRFHPARIRLSIDSKDSDCE